MTITTRHVDGKRRVVLPEEFEPGSDVIIEQIGDDAWMVTPHKKTTKLREIKLRVIERLPDDPKWDKVENAFARAAYAKLPPPPED